LASSQSRNSKPEITLASPHARGMWRTRERDTAASAKIKSHQNDDAKRHWPSCSPESPAG